MPNELIINVTLSETRVARLESGVVAELFTERIRSTGVVGNVYKGKVVRVLPGMQAAFVDIGLERTAFLHASDVVEGLKHSEDVDADDEEPAEETPKKRPRKSREDSSIQNLLHEGNEILVQVEKEPMGSKGARVTSHISLPGRFLVFMPTVHHIGASRRIADPLERERLKEIIRRLHQGPGGFIVRTVSEGLTEKELKMDIDYLQETWKEIESKAKDVRSAPTLVRAELGVLERAIRDQFTPDVDRLVVDSPEAHKQILSFVAKYMPDAVKAVELYKGQDPIFDAFGIEVEITRALGQKVWLKSGGYII
ncbi:MAG: ribonuclease E/G, partial [Deltaproteobacteria bacterium]|nr:ribonuclease E/G [Deltaproteobacteria bacterium]